MIPPVFELCSADLGVTAIFGENPLRIFPFGEAPKDTERPYAVWQTINGLPENLLDDVPEVDFFTVQIDVYGESSEQVLEAAEAIRDAIEREAYVTAWYSTTKDQETNDYRFPFSADFIVER